METYVNSSCSGYFDISCGVLYRCSSSFYLILILVCHFLILINMTDFSRVSPIYLTPIYFGKYIIYLLYTRV